MEKRDGSAQAKNPRGVPLVSVGESRPEVQPGPLDFSVVAYRLSRVEVDVTSLSTRATAAEVLLGIHGERMESQKELITDLKTALRQLAFLVIGTTLSIIGVIVGSHLFLK